MRSWLIKPLFPFILIPPLVLSWVDPDPSNITIEFESHPQDVILVNAVDWLLFCDDNTTNHWEGLVGEYGLTLLHIYILPTCADDDLLTLGSKPIIIFWAGPFKSLLLLTELTETPELSVNSICFFEIISAESPYVRSCPPDLTPNESSVGFISLLKNYPNFFL